jgi:N-acyl-D-aspartate/D-glutamate deacylase
MRAMAEEALAQGAIGISTGTAYAPARAATTEELIAVCEPLRQAGGIYATHMRNEDDAVIEAMEETFRIGASLGVAVVISHHKCVGKANHGRSVETLALIERTLPHSWIPRQPVTITLPFSCSASPIVSSDSALALSMKPQVLTTTTSASA